MKKRLVDIVEIIEREMSFAIDENNRDASFDTVWIEEEYLHFSNERGDQEFNMVLPLDQSVEFKNGMLTAVDIDGNMVELMIYKAEPLTI